MARALSKEEVRDRLIRLRNLERLHEDQRFKIWHLRDENRALKLEVRNLKLTVQAQQRTIEDLKLQMEELRTMVFGRKRQAEHQNDDDLKPPQEKIARTSDSYRRPIPKDEDVTEIRPHQPDLCACGTTPTIQKSSIFYEEDIPIPAKKIVVKHIVTKAYCPKCEKWNAGIQAPSAKVILGPNVQKYICYLSVLCRLSFTQIQNLLNDTYQFHVSEGEIAKILRREAIHLRPAYEKLKIKIRGEPVANLDETGWKLLMEGDPAHSWVMSGSLSKESIFLIGESRGGGNVPKLIGENYQGVIVSDDYGAYKKLPNHQLCWAHLLRHFRDLAKSGELNQENKKYCRGEYEKLCLIFEDLKANHSMNQYENFQGRLYKLSETKSDEPKKLIRIKTTLRKNISLYLTCLKDSRIPLTNNLAERSLRHLVLKRKISFGSFSKQTAEYLAVLLSVMMSFRQRYQSNFFGEYLKI